MSKLKMAAFIALTIAGAILIAYGITMQDILEVIANGAILCLSCVGIG